MKQKILENFERELPLLRALETRFSEKLRQVLEPERGEIHSLSSRIKDIRSLERKLRRPARTYEKLSDVTDLLGARIITYFEDTIERIAAIIEHEFDVDYSHSIDKRKSLDVSHF